MKDQLKNFLKIIGILALAIFQIVTLPSLAVYDVWPNLILILAVILVILGEEKDGFLVASLGALILDLASHWFFGFNLIIILSTLLLTRFLVVKFLNEPSIWAAMVVVMATVIFADLANSLMAQQFSLINFSITIVYSLMAGLITYQIIKHFLIRRPMIRI